MLQVSRPPLREALRKLEAEKLAGKGQVLVRIVLPAG